MPKITNEVLAKRGGMVTTEYLVTQDAAPDEIRGTQKLWELVRPGVHIKKNGRVDLSTGDKTPLGLFRTLKRFYEEHDANEKVLERNKKRAELAADILKKFAEYQDGDTEENEEILATYLLANMMHLLGDEQFDKVHLRAQDHYHAELNGEE